MIDLVKRNDKANLKKPTKEHWKKFAERIIEKNGNPSVSDAKDCGIPVGYFNEIIMRGNTKETLINNAKKVLANIK